VAFFLDCVEPLVPLRSGLMPAVLPYHRHLCWTFKCAGGCV